MYRYMLSLLHSCFFFPICFLLFYRIDCPAQTTSPFRMAFWNVENLFDCEPDTLHNDREFLPGSLRRWHYGRYKKKLTNIARVISALGEGTPPALVGLCEVENDRVIRDLVRYSPLKEWGYRYVMTDSSDPRGIDIALLYQRDRFSLLSWQAVPISDNKHSRSYRDILHVTGLLLSGDTLDVVVCHFPSRSAGGRETEAFRLTAARRVRSLTDSLMAVRTLPGIVIMGDLNDYPHNRSVKEVIGAGIPDPPYVSDHLYHLLARKAKKQGYGSYKHQGEWGLLDHLIVSGSLLDPLRTVYTHEDYAHVAFLPFLLIRDDTYGGNKPFRTYHGMKYQGGYSDHLPVYTDLLFRE